MNKKCIIEGALIAYGDVLSIDKIKKMFREDNIKEDGETLSVKEIKDILNEIATECGEKGYELKEIASGYRLQVKSEYSKWISKLWEEKPPRYSKTVLETMAIVAYKQPVTRAEIEEIRGVAVSTNVIRMLMDRQWIKIIAHKDVPGRPAVYGTTNIFLDYFE
ncbi:MAG: SMC-Scp complex subunit ScpB [Legionellales bacterium]|nr:SMC-Scp complex subunit ScpB [Legionellales bacterium]